MRHRKTCAILAALLAGCAAPYSDTANEQERKAYIACAVTRAFLHAGSDAAPETVALDAMRQCDGERLAVLLKLLEENAGKPFGAQFVQAYMDTLQATMIDHIALRIAQAREGRGGI
ncbi:hypothetical protein [Noviherbaspirillum denitrificans]|uniref:Lipoprotein n=1 Tax=Noviherbaspirillum denitrificans TaxID=1968433 RepID=A0A254T845_9BURK|nr:hypothetical protein [Noviherbaspirillum denitrificans]OWW18337.1 hypothetical protein AYR66_02510 [Noviherbaspirillum denitrificans]